MPRFALLLVLLAPASVFAEGLLEDEKPLNYEGHRGQAPSPMPAFEPWAAAAALQEGTARVMPFLRVEGYAHRKQMCTSVDVFRMPDGGFRARRLVYYRVGAFEDGAAAFEVDLENGTYLALKVDADVRPAQDGEATWDRPASWKPNVKAAWAGVEKAKPTEVRVAAPADFDAAVKDGVIVFHRATNVVVTGSEAVVREPKLDWSGLIRLVDMYANDPLVPRAPPGGMAESRNGCCAVLLADGRVLVSGGWKEGGKALSSAEIFDPSSGKFEKTGACRSVHGSHTMALCGDGRVLLVPGYGAPAQNRRPELFDPKDGSWSLVPAMARDCYCPVSEPLADGRVLVYDGSYDDDERAAEIFDPKTCTWSLTPKTVAVDTTTTLTRLQDGRVLLIGRGGPLGFNQIGTSIARLYDPAKNAWIDAPAPADVRASHTTTLLADGRVLVAGGAFFKPSAEIYDPKKDAWTPAADMATDRSMHAATLLADGRVLLIGGSFPMPSPPDLPIGEVFDPKSGTWSAAAKGVEVSSYPTAFTLADGSVLVLSNGGRTSWFTIKK